MSKKKIIYLISEDWFFISHFWDRAIAAKNSGFDVIIVCKDNGNTSVIRNNFTFLDFRLNRTGLNFFKDLFYLYKLFKSFKIIQPDIIHNIALKPIIYGTLISLILKVPLIVNAPVGMGYVFTSKDLLAKFLKPFISLIYKILLNPLNSKVIFENSEDLNYYINNNYVRKNDCYLIKGAGVNINNFFFDYNKFKIPTIILAARMLKDKGIYDYIKAAKILNSNGIKADFLLVGDVDISNPSSLSTHELNQINGHYGIKWLGHRSDIAYLLSKSHVACLPSFREGLPKFLLEASAAKLPIVTTDVVGCREVVDDGINGFLVPCRNPDAVANAIHKLISNPLLCQSMGESAYNKVVEEFSNEIIISKTNYIYNNFL
jgi:glycosyltransferase involved in cell wall biosynthesis